MFMLRKLRKEKGITMRELGDIIGVAESTISQYETEKRSPDFETLLKFGSLFNVTVDYLLTGEESAQKNALPITEEDAIKQEIIDILNQLPPEAYPRAQKILEAVFEVPPKLPLK